MSAFFLSFFWGGGGCFRFTTGLPESVDLVTGGSHAQILMLVCMCGVGVGGGMLAFIYISLHELYQTLCQKSQLCPPGYRGVCTFAVRICALIIVSVCVVRLCECIWLDLCFSLIYLWLDELCCRTCSQTINPVSFNCRSLNQPSCSPLSGRAEASSLLAGSSDTSCLPCVQ